jgi:hypothetical protein
VLSSSVMQIAGNTSKMLPGTLLRLLWKALCLCDRQLEAGEWLSSSPRDALPAETWVLSEADAMLTSSQDRVRSLEGKGPALAAVCTVVGAAVGAAISLTWGGSTVLAKILLVGAASYCAVSLRGPLAVAGPLNQATVEPASLQRAASSPDPVAFLARRKLRAARTNYLIARRLAALQTASRDALLRAILMFVLWSALALSGYATGPNRPSDHKVGWGFNTCGVALAKTTRSRSPDFTARRRGARRGGRQTA